MWVVAWLAVPMDARGATIACDQVKTCVQSGPESTCSYDVAATAPDVLHVTMQEISPAYRVRGGCVRRPEGRTRVAPSCLMRPPATVP